MSINRPVLLIIAGAALAAVLALAVPVWRHWHEVPPPPPLPLRLALFMEENLVIGAGPDHPFGLALAPDGRRIAFPATRGGAEHIWVREVTTGESTALPGTANGVLPFWSRDGHRIGFFADGRLKLFSFENAQTTDLAEAPAPRGGAFDANGHILFTPRNEGGLLRRRADDGSVEPLTSVDATNGETSHRFPVVLDGGRHVLFYVRAAAPSRSGIWIAALDAPDQRARLVGGEANALTSGDWVVYAQQDALLAQQLTGLEDDKTPSFAGRPMLVGTSVGQSPLNQLSASIAADTIVFGAPQPQRRDLRWMERDGSGSTLASGVEAWDVRVAPNSGRVAVTQRDAQLGTLDVWVYEGSRPLPRRISQSLDIDESAAWSPDASRLAWVQARRAITLRGALAQLPEQSLRKFDTPIRLWNWSPDGQQFVIGFARPATKEDLFVLPATGAGEPVAYAQSAFNETHGAISPDGKWLAYASDESGQPEVYIDAIPMPGRRARVTVGGGTEPRWQSAGSELFFRRGSEIHAVAIAFTGDVPEATSTTRVLDAGGDIRSYDVTPDGRRFLVNVPAPGVRAQPINVVVHWRSLVGSPVTGGPR